MNKISFLDYFNKTNTVNKETQRVKATLNEGLKEIKPNVYPNISVYDAACFLTLLPGYSEDIFDSTIELQFDSEDHFNQFDELVAHQPNSVISSMDNLTDKSVAAKNVTDIPFSSLGIDAQRMEADILKKYVQDMRTPIFKKMKAAGVQGVNIMFTDGSMQLIGDDPATVARIVGLVRQIFSDGTVSKNAVELIGLGQQMNKETDKKGARFAELKQRGADIMKELNQALNAIQLPDSPADEDVATVSDRTKTSEAKIVKEYSGGILDVYAVFLMFQISRGLIDKDSGQGIAKDIIDELSNKLTAVSDKRPDKKYKSYNAAILKAFADGDFINAIRMDGNISEFHRLLLQLFDKKFQKGLDDKINKQLDFIAGQLKQADLADDKRKQLEAQKKQLDFEKAQSGMSVRQTLNNLLDNMFAFKVSSYIKQHREIHNVLNGRETNGEDVSAERAMYPQITKFQSFNTLMKTVQDVFDTRILKLTEDQQKDEQEKRARLEAVTYKNTKHSAANPCANRRWKLFEDLHHMGAEIFSNDDWVACVITSVQQVSVFGRNKPKVDSAGKIIEQANLRDDEGITPQNRAIRDGEGLYVKDGISRRYDSKGTESGWCVAGSLSKKFNKWNHTGGYWNYGVIDSKTTTSSGVLVAMMQLRSGRLFLFGRPYTLGELDDRDERFFGDGGDGFDCMKRGFRNFPALEKLWKDSGLYDRLGFNSKTLSPKQLYENAVANGKITPNGEFKIANADELRVYKEIFSEASKLVVTVSDASELFANFSGELPPVDCSSVRSASQMFSRANILNKDGLMLMHTEKITDMSYMFDYAMLSEIRGLNTQSATTLYSCFNSMKQKRFQMINIPELDLRSCRNIAKAFTYSYVAGIKLKNTDQVTDAHDAFVGCSLMTVTPDIRFKRMLSENNPINFMRSSEDADDFVNIFDGCDSLLNTEDFDRSIDAVRKFYANPQKEKSITDERGYLIIRNADDVAKYYRKFYSFPGVVLDKSLNDSGTARLFNQKHNFKIRILDLNGCRTCNQMIYGCTRFFIGKIIGSENVISAAGMFTGSLCGKLPELNFPALRGEINVFTGMGVFLNSSPLDENKNVIVTGQSIKPFASDLGPEDIARKLFGHAAETWIDETAIGQVVGAIYGRNVERYKGLIAAKYKINDKGEYELQPEDIENLQFILGIKGLTTLRLSDKLTQQIKKNNPFADQSQVWRDVNPAVKLPIIDFNGAEDITGMFRGLKCQSIAGFAGYQNVKVMNYTFCVATVKDFSSFPLDMMKNVTHAVNCFDRFTSDTTIDVNRLNLSSLIDGASMFLDCTAMPKDIDMNMPNLHNATGMFTNCAIVRVKRFSAPKCLNTGYAFSACQVLEYVNTVDFPEATEFIGMFTNCPALKSIVRINAPKARDVSNAFIGCYSLRSIHIAYFAEGAGSRQIVFSSPLKYVYGESGEKFFNLCRRLKGRGKTS